jgi:hypothetical protein
MTAVGERFHAWSHLVLFLMLFMIAIAVMRMGGPTGLAAGNQSIPAQGVVDLNPFLTAVGLLMGLFIAIVIALSADGRQAGRQLQAATREQKEPGLDAVNRELAKIRSKLHR